MSGAVETEMGSEPRRNVSAGTGILAGRYAGALYDLADEQHAIDRTIDEIEQLGRMIDETETLRRLLASPLVRASDAQTGLDAMLAGAGFSELVQRFVGVVAANRRLPSLRAIVAAFAALAAARRGVVTAEVASAHALTDVQRTQIQARLAESGFSNVRINASVDPSLIGGLTLRVGARLYDASIKSRLQRLAYRMKGAA